MREGGLVLRADVGGRELLIPASDLQEVMTLEDVEPFPTHLAGLAGVVPFHGEPLPLLDWEVFQTATQGAGLIAVLKRRLGIPIHRVLEVRDSEGAAVVGLKRGDPWNPLLGHRLRLSGHSQAVLDVEKLLALLHNRGLRR
jgi:chemotaxis signal transduction protein